MKTKHVKDTGQMVRRGQIGNITRGRQTVKIARVANNCTGEGGEFPLLAYNYSPPLVPINIRNYSDDILLIHL